MKRKNNTINTYFMCVLASFFADEGLELLGFSAQGFLGVLTVQ